MSDEFICNRCRNDGNPECYEGPTSSNYCSGFKPVMVKEGNIQKNKDGSKQQRKNRQVVNLNNVKRMLYRGSGGLEIHYLNGKGKTIDLNRANFTHFERPEKMGMFLNIGDFHPFKCEVVISTHESFGEGSHGTCGVYIIPINESKPSAGLLFAYNSAEKITLADLVRMMIKDEWLIQSSTPKVIE